jgi:hypothetical protein
VPAKRLYGRKRIQVAMGRELQRSFSAATPVPEGACASDSKPRWLTRDELHNRIFKRIEELNLPIERDIHHGNGQKKN